ncbi:heme exporter protein CcmB [Solitalea koreensis]|uniref:Heme exporter protein B n=1 Tax=Solitalea koreensis TaxID=543615 RepID=A0A521D2D1_9SPHI|nr:heme exporter protein CcmB [Solitalea koreensis]SMO65843.1 heme exporter protein B [Solitalea koreensis]
MNLYTEVRSLIKKELVLEWRSKYALNGVLLYVAATVFICYQSFKRVDPITWNALFWVIMLFAAINAVAKSFMNESRGRQLYYYTLASPHAIIISKIIYNFLLMMLLSAIALFFYNVVFQNPIGDVPLYLLSVIIGSLSFSTAFTMISAIASKANNNATLMAILGFPIIVPILIGLIKLSKNAMDGLDRSVSGDEIMLLMGINVIVVVTSLLLFPYLWRE